MKEITIAVGSDPMKEVMDCLFEDGGEILISDEVLETMKRSHSFTMKTMEGAEEYTFHKRGRGTHAFFSFSVKTGSTGNSVTKLECYSELGLIGNSEKIREKGPKVYVKLFNEAEHF